MLVDKQDAAALWDKASQLIKSQINGVSYDSWFKDIQPVDFDGDTLTLMVNIEFIRNMLRNNYDQLIRAAVSQSAGRPIDYVIGIPSEYSAPALKDAPRLNPSQSMLNPKYTFSTYVIGKSNNFAHAAAYAVSQSPGNTYNPLFLYSGVGLGKTHLMHAIGHTILEKNPDAKILYITSETFTNDLIKAISTNTNIEFRNRYRNVDVLMVDDIQFIAGKEQTQEEFFHTFNALYEARKQIVISSDKPPKDIPTLEERLRSRFEWGLIADISKPDLETRIAILRKKAEMEHLDVPDEVNTYIATKVESNIRELEGCLTRVLAYANLTGAPVTEALAAEALRDMLPVKDPRRITTDLIMAIVAEYYSVTVDDLKSKRRNREVTVPRQIAMYLIRELNGASLPRIGMEFGGRDHTTVIHACDKVAEDLRRDAQLKGAVETLKKRIQGA
jgi:chromosomal replication initiator protein